MADEVFYDLPGSVRTIFSNLLTPRAVKKNGKEVGEPRYDITLALDPDDPILAQVREQVKAVALAEWPGRAIMAEAKRVDKDGVPRIPTFKFPFQDGTALADKGKKEGKDREASRGKIVFQARSKFAPALGVVKNGQLLDLNTPELITANKAAFYYGVNALVGVSFLAYSGDDDRADGVTARLYKVVSLNTGDKIGNGGKSRNLDSLKSYVGLRSPVDPTGGDPDDEIPF